MPLPGHGLFCPQQHWLDLVAPVLAERAENGLTLLNAGVNKGFTAASLMQRFGRWPVQNVDWFRGLQQYLQRTGARGTIHLCGVCCACIEPRPMPVTPVRSGVHLYAFEPVRQNYAFVLEAFARHSTSKAVALVLHAALGNQRDAQVSIGMHSVVGKENVSPRLLGHNQTPDTSYVRVPVIVLDDWLPQQGISHVDLAMFDAEGWDLAILDGMNNTLAERRVKVFEFESTAKLSPVPGMDLERTLMRLHRLGYACFFEYDNGCLAPASKPCLPPHATFLREHQNLVCALTDFAPAFWHISDACVAGSKVQVAPPNRSWLPKKGCGSDFGMG